jgi:hypothetical protein
VREGARIASNAFLWAFGGKRITDAKVTPKALSHLLSFKDQAIAKTNLPGCIGKVVAVSTSPGVPAWSKQLQYLAATSAYEERSLPTEVPRCPGNGERLTIKGDRRVVPVPGLDAFAKELITRLQPISGSLAYVRGLAQVADVQATRLLDRSSAVSTRSRQRSNTRNEPDDYRPRTAPGVYVPTPITAA